MCGRFTLTVPPAVLAEWAEAVAGVDFPPRYNIAPTQPVLVIYTSIDGPPVRKAELMRWGLVPVWVKDPKDFPLIINARVETLMEKPAFRGALRHHRCVVPASGYYEWQKAPDGKKQPFYIARADGEPMAFAGIWSTWLGPDGSEIDTVAIITVPANADTRHIHDRMPAILGKSQIDDWLDIRTVGEKQAYDMLVPSGEGTLVSRPVSARVGNIRNDDEGLMETATEPAPEPQIRKVSGQLDLF